MKNKNKWIVMAAGFTACCFAFLNYMGGRKRNSADRVSFYEFCRVEN